MPETKSYSIVAFDVIPWGGPWMNRQQILSRLAERHDVVYSRGAFHLWDRFTPDWNQAPLRATFTTQYGVRVHERTKALLRVTQNAAVDRYVLRRLASVLNREVAGGTNTKRIAYVFHPSLYPCAKALNADLLVYHPYDQFAAYPGITTRELELENELVCNADLVIASSAVTAESFKRYADRHVEVIANGVDFERFAVANQNASIPDDLASIPEPRIAYFGSINEKVDLRLIERLAAQRPKWNFVFVGGVRVPEHIDNTIQRTRLLPNVHYLGQKRYSEVADYCRHMNVNLLAYRVGEGLWSEACSPLKLYEYLATGVPVVSAKLQVVEPYRDSIAVAQSDDEWIEAIERALADGGPGSSDSRRAIAKVNTWESRVENIETLIEGALK